MIETNTNNTLTAESLYTADEGDGSEPEESEAS
jgi:hypothetical protein